MMSTEIARTDTDAGTREAVARAVELLAEGKVVALPTETVYGLAADATNADAVAEIYEVKERPSFDPLIVHVPHKRALDGVAIVPEEISPYVARLIETWWPGPLTLLLPKAPELPDIVTAGLPHVAVRVSSHPVFKKIAKTLGRPIAAPSANRFGRISPTSASAVEEEMGGRIPLIVDGGACNCGVESTIIKVEPPVKEGAKPFVTILRAGPVTKEDLQKVGKVLLAKKNETVLENAPEAPGMLENHYAPSKPLRLIEEAADFIPEEGLRYGLLSYRGQEDDGILELHPWERVEIMSPGSGKVPEAAVRLFYLMRELDADDSLDEIIVEAVPKHGVGLAVMDRLTRASSKRT